MKRYIEISFLLSMASIVLAGCGSSELSPPQKDPPVDGGTTCGNGVVEVEHFEECDPGRDDNVGCDAKCKIPERRLGEEAVNIWSPARIAASSQGYLVGWATDGFHLRARLLDEAGNVNGAELKLDADEQDSYLVNSLRLTSSPEGFLAVWMANANGRQEYGARFRALQFTGAMYGNQERAFTLPASDSIGFGSIATAPAEGSQGYSFVYAHDHPSRLRHLPVSIDGIPGQPAAAPISTQAENRYVDYTLLAPAPDGRNILVWHENDSITQSLHVSSLKNGVPFWSVTVPIHEHAFRPEVAAAVTNEGNVFVVWSEHSYTTRHFNGILITEDGALGSVFEVAKLGPRQASFNPVLAYSSSSGEFLFLLPDGAKRLTSKGEAIDADWFPIPTEGWRSVSGYAAAGGKDGSFLVAYTGYGPGGRQVRCRILPRGFRTR